MEGALQFNSAMSGGGIMDNFKDYIHFILKGSLVDIAEKKDLEDELYDHLNMLKQDYLSKGYSKDDAVHEAIKTFGDSQELKNNFRKFYMLHGKFNIFRILLIIIGFLPLSALPFLSIYGTVQVITKLETLFGENIRAYYSFYLRNEGFLFFGGLSIIGFIIAKIYTPKPYGKLISTAIAANIIAIPFTNCIYFFIYDLQKSFYNGMIALLYGNVAIDRFIEGVVITLMILLCILLGLFLYKKTSNLRVSFTPCLAGFLSTSIHSFFLLINLLIYRGFDQSIISSFSISFIHTVAIYLGSAIITGIIIFILTVKQKREIKRDGRLCENATK